MTIGAKMILMRQAEQRGHTSRDWILSKHTFSFSDYYDPRYMGFSDLKVINEDIIEPGNGFAAHTHSDVEIFSYVLSGSLRHTDGFDRTSELNPGTLQYTSAGSGMMHTEWNVSEGVPAHVLQIWMRPNEAGGEPRYEQRTVAADGDSRNSLTLLASATGKQRAIRIKQDAFIYFGSLKRSDSLVFPMRHYRKAWIQMLQGIMHLQKETLRAGDGAAIASEQQVKLIAKEDSEFLLFDLR